MKVKIHFLYLLWYIQDPFLRKCPFWNDFIIVIYRVNEYMQERKSMGKNMNAIFGSDPKGQINL